MRSANLFFVKAGEPHLAIPVHKGQVEYGDYKEAKRRCGEAEN
jgi:hypothetical protein